MKNKPQIFDIIIIGAGISGSVCALEIEGIYNILIIDAGSGLIERNCPWETTNICKNCNPCNLIAGFGGCLKSGDSAKISFPPSGKRLLEKTTNFNNISDYINKTYLGSLKKQQTKRAYANFTLKEYPIAIIDSHSSTNILQEIYHRIQNKNNISLCFKERVLDYEKKDCYIIHTDKQIYKTKNIVFATGRFGKEWLKKMIHQKNFKYTYSRALVGVRFEMPAEILKEPGLAHPDFKFTKRFGDFDKVKTFCFCGGLYGGVIKYLNYGNIKLLDGHILSEEKNKLGNFALLHSVGFDILENIKNKYISLNNGNIIRQSFLEFKKREKGLSAIFPPNMHEHLIITLEELFKKAFNNYSLADVSVYGLEIENDWFEVKTNQYLEIDNQTGLFVCGDAATLAQGLLQAAISGYIVAQNFR